ncbi:MAG: histidine kinase [Sediminicola sp.]|tara:strand:- start:26826 stop:27890 length:1065 start_codon:yes stop_codon:yes gene_type:complete
MSQYNKRIREVLTHILVWASLYGIILFQFYYEFRTIPKDLVVRLLVNVLLFYFNYSFLVPRMLLKKQIGKYMFVSLGLIFGSILLTNIFFEPEHPIPPQEMAQRFVDHRRPFFGWVPLLMPSMILAFNFLVGSILKVYVEWNNNDILRKKVETEKINSELQFLKTQLNPHFLFNSLNAIYSLSVKKSPDTSEAIINLSELMRYMLYEANREFVPLADEMTYIQNYVQLQRLRLSHSENVTLNISGMDKDKFIPPLLFISFIENAFKYGTDYKGRTNVKISLIFTDQSIQLLVQNKIGFFKTEPKNSGVGLENIKNRLKLLYPDSHNLTVENDGEYYTVHLILNTHKNEMYHNRR